MIAAIVVTFHPEQGLLRHLISSLSHQVDQIIVVDNTDTPPTKNSSAWLKEIVASGLWLGRGSNLGIAEAQNLGIEKARQLGAKRVLLLDQDSEVGENFVRYLVCSAERLEQQGVALACIGPRPYCLHENRLHKPRVQKELNQLGEVTLVRQIIASGMLISMASLEQVGLKESRLFIDGVDHEWCWRAAKKGYVVGVCEHVIMPHRLGSHRGSILALKYKVDSPVRLYYQFRNILLLSRRGYVPTYWKLRNLLALPVRFALMSLFEKPRFKRCHYMLKGLWHGLSGKAGKLEE